MNKFERVYLIEAEHNYGKSTSLSWIKYEDIKEKKTRRRKLGKIHQALLMQILRKYPNRSSFEVHNENERANNSWMQRGWLDHMLQFISSALDPKYSPEEDLRADNLLQVRMWGVSTTLKLSYAADSYFFKAVTKCLKHAINLTSYLKDFFPYLIPDIVAYDDELGYIITGDIKGEELCLIKKFDIWEKVLSNYGVLQVALSEKVEELVELSVPMRDIDWLLNKVELILLDDKILRSGRGGGMQDQEIMSIRGLSLELRNLCIEYKNLALPYSIEHGDLHAKNIIIKEDNIYFIDWSHSSISIPFISIFALLEEAAKIFSEDQVNSLKQSYLNKWLDNLDKDKVNIAFSLLELIYYLHQAAIHYDLYYAPGVELRHEVSGGVSHFMKKSTIMLKQNYCRFSAIQ